MNRNIPIALEIATLRAKFVARRDAYRAVAILMAAHVTFEAAARYVAIVLSGAPV